MDNTVKVNFTKKDVYVITNTLLVAQLIMKQEDIIRLMKDIKSSTFYAKSMQLRLEENSSEYLQKSFLRLLG